jgi:hypothetical protein
MTVRSLSNSADKESSKRKTSQVRYTREKEDGHSAILPPFPLYLLRKHSQHLLILSSYSRRATASKITFT